MNIFVPKKQYILKAMNKDWSGREEMFLWNVQWYWFEKFGDIDFKGEAAPLFDQR